MPFTIIAPTPGPTTREKILELILTHPQGITVKKLSDRLNRPVSMVQCYLNSLKSSNIVQAKFNPEDRQWIYYPIA
ncbi:MAG: winged helix-turn-helix domain-containing protein [Cyanobacteria bacterium P01_G01_bin.49]